jgi:hypothetical protein
MTKETWDRIVKNGYKKVIQKGDPFGQDFMTPERAKEVIGNAASEFKDWQPPK